MCPSCMANLALITASVTSTGGVAALVAGQLRRRNHKQKERDMNTPSIVGPQEWEAARQQLLVKEKALTRARDALAAERRRMRGWPWRRSTSSTDPGAKRATDRSVR